MQKRPALPAMTAKTLAPQPHLPLPLPLLTTFPLASSQGRRASLEAAAEHVVLTSRRPPNYLRAGAILAWGISAITAISR